MNIERVAQNIHMTTLAQRLNAYKRTNRKFAEEKSILSIEHRQITQNFFAIHPLTNASLSLPEKLTLSFATEDSAANLLFFDLESTGLGSSEQVYPFLIGIARNEDNGMCFSAFFATTPAGESEILTEFIAASAGKTLVSFNGKSFDLPLIIRRANKYNLKHNLSELKHIDLFHLIRRIYPEKPARLIDAENRLLGFTRPDDIAGATVAQTYFESLRFDRRDLTEKILQHNTWDVLSLVSLTQQVATAFARAREGKTSWAYKIYRDKSANREQQKTLLNQPDLVKLDARDYYALGKIFRSEKNYLRATWYFMASYHAGYNLAVVDAVRSLARQKKLQSAQRLARYALAREDERVQRQLVKFTRL